jgi:hypothetical protein
MQTYEFNAVAESNDGISQEYLKDISSTAKTVIFAKDEECRPPKKTFKAMKMHTKDFHFDREEANER